LIRSNCIENWIRIEIDHQIVTLLKSLLQPFKNAVFVPHSCARFRDHTRRNVSSFRSFSIISQPLSPKAFYPGPAKRFRFSQTQVCSPGTALTFTTVHARAALAIPRTGPLRDALIMGPELDKDFGASWFSRRRISKGPVRARGTSRPGVECLELTLHLLVLEFPKTAGLGVSLLRLRELRALCRGLCANSAAAPYRRTYRQEPNPQSTKCRSVAKNLL